jgi:hypothetical protein
MDENNVKRRWLRFSLKALFVVLTIVGVYLGLWEATKKWGVIDLKSFLAQQDDWVDDEDISVKMPLVIEAGDLVFAGGGADPLAGSTGSLKVRQRYFFWFFGYVAQLYATDP